MSSVEVSFILSVYNAQNYLRECLVSIQRQSYENFEVICIDDGSTDRSQDVLQEFCELDHRFKLYKQDNKGLVYSLNKAIRLSRGRYIARIDADDICFEDRILRQLEQLNKTNAAVCSSFAKTIDGNGRVHKISIKPFSRFFEVKSDEEIGSCLLFDNPIIHPTVMIDREKTGEFIYPNVKHSEDLSLWHDLKSQGLLFTIIKEPLIYYRLHTESVSSVNSSEQKRNAYFLFLEYIENKAILSPAFKGLLLGALGCYFFGRSYKGFFSGLFSVLKFVLFLIFNNKTARRPLFFMAIKSCFSIFKG
ncbi:MAG: glycosyltransferase family 2 protein [Motiliproteus sp.]